MYVKQLVEQCDARMASDAERVDDEQEAAADGVRPVELRLPDLEHLRGRREARHVREEAEEEVGRVVELPAHRQLDEVAQRAAGHGNPRAVRLVVAEQARVVREAVLLEQVRGVRPERERRRSIPFGRAPNVSSIRPIPRRISSRSSSIGISSTLSW